MSLSRSVVDPIERLYRHGITVSGPLLLSGLLLGSGLAILRRMQGYGAWLVLLLMAILLGRTLIHPLACWWVFEVRVYPDRLEVRYLAGLHVERVVYDLTGSTVRLSRGMLDAFLGTGTLTFSTVRETVQYRLLTPADALERSLIYLRSRKD